MNFFQKKKKKCSDESCNFSNEMDLNLRVLIRHSAVNRLAVSCYFASLDECIKGSVSSQGFFPSFIFVHSLKNLDYVQCSWSLDPLHGVCW